MKTEEKLNFNEYKCLLIHAGVPSIARGLYSMFYTLNKNKIKTDIICIDNENFKEIQNLDKYSNLLLIGISIHWHPQLAISIKLAEYIKAKFKSKVKIVIGGITAGYFAEEFLKYKFIDFVIKGDGTEPMLQLFWHIEGKFHIKLSAIPNLYYNNADNAVISNNITYSIDDNSLTESEIEAIEKYDLLKKSRFMVGVGRGCDKNCIYCGGSKIAYNKWGNNVPVLKRDVNNIKKVVELIFKNKVDSVYFENGYNDGDLKFTSQVLSEFNLSKLQYLTIGCSGLPIIENLHKIFTNTPKEKKLSFDLELSPETANDENRKRIKYFYFSNENLEKFLCEFFNSYPNYSITIFFSYYLPFSEKENTENRKYIFDLTKKFLNIINRKKLNILFSPLSTDPGSTIQRSICDEIKCNVNSFDDYISQMFSIKYNTGNFLKHHPKEINEKEAGFYHMFFRFENYIRIKFPKFFINLVDYFKKFDQYCIFILNCFQILYDTLIISMETSSLNSQLFDECSSSIFGFEFKSDELLPEGRISLIWLLIIKNKLIKEANRYEINDYIAEPVKCNSKTISSYNELYRYVIELIELIISQETYKLYLKDEYKINYFSLLSDNINKIEILNQTDINGTIDLIPLKNPLCAVIQLQFCDIDKTTNHKENLSLLGYQFFEKIIEVISFNQLLKDYLHNDILKTILYLDNFDDFNKNHKLYWDKIIHKENNVFYKTLSDVIILALCPIEKILNHLKIPNKDGFIDFDFEFTCDIIKNLTIENFFNPEFLNEDIRLISFYLNYIAIEYSIPLKSIYAKREQPFFFNINLISEEKKFVYNFLDMTSYNVLKLCDGKNTLNDIVNIINCGNRNFDSLILKNILVYLYHNQLIF